MTRSERLAQTLMRESFSRRAAPEDFDPKSRDKDDLVNNEEDPTDIEEGWNLNPKDSKEKDSFFDEDEDDELSMEDEEHEHHSSPETLRKTRLKLLAGMVWAYLGEPTAVVEESAPNELSVKVQDLSWRVFVNEDGRVNISGFSSGSDHFVGKIPVKDAEASILKISKNIHKLISDDIDEKSIPTEPPVHFGPDEEPGEDVSETEEGEESPAAPEGDQGVSQEALPQDMSTSAPSAEPVMSQPQPAAPPAPGAVPPAQPLAPQPNPVAPMASVLRFPHHQNNSSRKSSWNDDYDFEDSNQNTNNPQYEVRRNNKGWYVRDLFTGEMVAGPFGISGKGIAEKKLKELQDKDKNKYKESSRKTTAGRLEEVSGQLRSIGDSLGDDEEEGFRALADRVDQVNKTLEQTSP